MRVLTFPALLLCAATAWASGPNDDTALMPTGFNETWQWVDGDLTVVSIPGAAHFIQHEAEALVTDSIVAWLER